MHRRAVLAVLILFVSAALARASGVATVRLSATRMAVLNDGRDATEIIAEVRDSNGNLVPDNTPVSFTTDKGNLASQSVFTRAGFARVRMTGSQKGTAKVMATTGGNYPGGVQTLDILFTDDQSETFQGNAYIAMEANGSNTYGPTQKVVEAVGHPRPDPDKGYPGAHLTYRNIDIVADTIQFDCGGNYVIALGGVTLTRGTKHLSCYKLQYNMRTSEGFAIAEVEKRLKPVKIKGFDIHTEPIVAPPGAVPIPPDKFNLKPLVQEELLITARQILVFPNEKLQFKRPRFYQNGQPLVSMAFYSMAMYTQQVFTDQLVSVGSQGLGVDIPVYYDLSPTSTGIFSVRHGEQSGRSTFSRNGGWSLDLAQGYNSLGATNRYTGQVTLTGMQRSDWGLRWNHSQELSSNTRGTFFLDFPQHQSVFGATNLNKQMGPLYVGFNLSGNQSLTGPISVRGVSSDAYVETAPKKVGKTGYLFTLGGTTSYFENHTGAVRGTALTEGIQARVYSRPFRLDKETTLTNYFTVGNSWGSNGSGGRTIMATLSAQRAFKGGNLQVGYDFTQQPNILTAGGNHRLSANLYAGLGGKWSANVLASTMLDGPMSNIIGDLNYAIAPRWRLSFSTTIQRFLTGQYQDYELGLGRSVGGRELVIFYSTFTHRFFFDLEASRF